MTDTSLQMSVIVYFGIGLCALLLLIGFVKLGLLTKTGRVVTTSCLGVTGVLLLMFPVNDVYGLWLALIGIAPLALIGIVVLAFFVLVLGALEGLASLKDR